MTTNTQKEMINRHLKFLWEKNTSISLKLLAVEYLSQFTSDKEVFEKLSFFHDKEKNRVLKKKLKMAIDGHNLFSLASDEDSSWILSSEEDTTNPSYKDLNLYLKSRFISSRYQNLG